MVAMEPGLDSVLNKALCTAIFLASIASLSTKFFSLTGMGLHKLKNSLSISDTKKFMV